MTTNTQLALDLAVRSSAGSLSSNTSIRNTATSFLNWLNDNTPEPPPEPVGPAIGLRLTEPAYEPQPPTSLAAGPRTAVLVEHGGPTGTNVTYLSIAADNDEAVAA